MKPNLPKIFFLLSLGLALVVYGFASHATRIFPFSLFEKARLASLALIDVFFKDEAPVVDFWDDSGLKAPNATRLSEAAGSETLLILGNPEAYHPLCGEVGCLAWIADREGQVLHAWKNTPDLWSPLEHHEAIRHSWSFYPVGAYLYPNGDLLISYHGKNVFPFGMGLAKFDKDSRLLWKRNGYSHHWFSVDAEGKIYVPGKKVVDTPLTLEDRAERIACKNQQFHFEVLDVLDPDGRLLKKIDLYRAMVESDLTGVFSNNGDDLYTIETCDPMHLNDVRVLSKEVARAFPSFSPGDFLLSFRSLNALAVLDPKTERFKWIYTGALRSPHSPRFAGHNQILAFDNLGGTQSRGTSRIVAIDVASKAARIVFPKPEAPLPAQSFFSESAGHIDLAPDGKRLLVSFTHQGLAWEIDSQSGAVLWEYTNTHPIHARFGRIPIYTALYANPNFPLNGGKISGAPR